jgi:hypothetical protein
MSLPLPLGAITLSPSRRHAAIGLIGSALVAFGGIGAGAVPYGVDPVAQKMGLTWLHESYWGRWLSLALVICGLGLLSAAWWRLGRIADLMRTSSVLKLAGLWCVPLLLAPPLFSRDLYAYVGQGHLVSQGFDPYEVGPVAAPSPLILGMDPVWLWSPSPYGPVFLGLAARVTAITGEHPLLAVLSMRLLAVAGLALVAWALPRLARAHGRSPQRALWLGLANPLVLMHGVGGGHNDALMIGLLIAGLAVLQTTAFRGHTAVAAALVTLAVLVKVPAIAALAFFPLAVHGSRMERLRAAVIAACTAVVTAVTATAVSGLSWGWLHQLDAGRARLSLFSPVTGVGVALGWVLEHLGLVDSIGRTLDVVLALGIILAAGLALLLLARAPQVGAVRALGLTLVAVVILGPVVQPWYLLWGIVLLAAVVGERAHYALAALSIALCLALMPNGKSIIRPPFYGAPIIAAVGLAVVEVRRAKRPVPLTPNAAMGLAAR